MLCCIAKVHAQKHPYLFFGKNKVDELKSRIKTDTFINNNWNNILAEANNLLVKGDPKGKIDYLSLAWLVTGERKYADKVKEVLIALCKQKNGAMKK